ncbi:hypothetical protein SAMN05660489_02374 [Pseudomonas sp. LAMO17WK12:I10]|uniref:hypothetical protein n=1 Tax=unclassified Pseudomonas TaxID=196821 RepID=UPI000BCCE3AE|nr:MULTISPECIES: hypothetical protein [unclassified Pseudomonas]PXX73119.1 hypothetical protein H160_02459 [Pseudomonas sp. LAMO17WK12:I9]SNY28561.1 hypothetical protein SAMN05660489_02374 [Pseudomonas sp. LAMO17WK12:I10]
MPELKMMLGGIMLAGIAGCTGAQMVSSPDSGAAYAPVNEGTRLGVIKYLNDGADTVRKMRREDAYKQMHAACKGRYRIESEGSNPEGGTAFTSGSGTYWAQSNYWYIQFSCV